MSENGEIYTAGKNFTLPPAVTAWTNSNSVKTEGHINLWKRFDAHTLQMDLSSDYILYLPNIHGHISERLMLAFAIIFRWMCQTHKIWKEIIPMVKSNLRFAAFVFSPLLKWWWMTISRLQLLWPSCRPAFAQPAVKLSLKAVVKSCHSLNYDMMSWLHKRTIIWGSSYQDRAKRRGFMSALHPLTGAHLRIV